MKLSDYLFYFPPKPKPFSSKHFKKLLKSDVKTGVKCLLYTSPSDKLMEVEIIGMPNPSVVYVSYPTKTARGMPFRKVKGVKLKDLYYAIK